MRMIRGRLLPAFEPGAEYGGVAQMARAGSQVAGSSPATASIRVLNPMSSFF